MAELFSFGDTTPFTVSDPSETRYEELIRSKKRKGGDVVAIFVHAGAGYHSVTNEHVHLKACGDACSIAMGFLRSGASAVQAVEAAIRVLEDNDITNAGYGSNLSLDGTVECDASIVDHYGRSGAVGAISQVMHPIHVAREVLEGTVHKMTLKRVPPNMLVGQGATDFAWEKRIPVLPPDALVSPAARERFRRWQQDLDEAEAAEVAKERQQPRASTPDQRVLASLVNEAQPPTPALIGSPSIGEAEFTGNVPRESEPSLLDMPIETESLSLGTKRDLGNGAAVSQFHKPRAPQEDKTLRQVSDAIDVQAVGSANSSRNSIEAESKTVMLSARGDGIIELEAKNQSQQDSGPKNSHEDDPRPPISPSQDSDIEMQESALLEPSLLDGTADPNYGANSCEDHITDTVGAIAVDCLGRIAAASSSGGIGMKHKGRTGPAALVGIGTAVHPVHNGDKERKTTAAVTSGTGEHMATTLAAGTCADRLYHNEKLAPNGSLADAEDEESLSAFIKDGFMGHPSVKHSNTAAAIGILAVKKTANGLWFHFAHNTDSFAVSSMTSEDEEPMALMSRARQPNDGNVISTGGRSCTWYPTKESKDSKRRRVASQKEDRARDRHVLPYKAKSRLLNALRPLAGSETPTISEDEKAKSQSPNSKPN